ncbi:MAG: hypothetical protein A2521_00500 [Deltaproteobacteria bacterium RIFOXYD12_FULL_57_12]|nr:MAG: hypothetical protein A2521_00500 [Deltaproteobacteria bacterium RIFOXYD12_FULL_57_12]
MRYRRFGRTNLRMPVLSAGFMRCMHGWQDLPLADIPRAGQANLEAVVHRALALGITHLETARDYGTSERQLGRLLPELPRDSFLIQTKVQPVADPAVFTAHVLDSLARLNLQRVDLLAIHGINDHRTLWYACRPQGCLAAARRLQAEGWIGHIGFSGHGDTEVILAAVRHEGDSGFDYLNIHWYYIFQRHWSAIAEADARDMGVFIISPTDKGGMLQAPPPLLVELSRPLSPMQFNGLFCLASSEVDTMSIGAATPADFDAHLAMLTHLDRAAEISEPIDRRWRQVMQATTGHERPDALWDLLPAWETTPGYINLPFTIWLDNLARGWGMQEYAWSRYRGMGQDIPWVPGNTAAELDRFDLTRVFRNSSLDPHEIIEYVRQAHGRLVGGW